MVKYSVFIRVFLLSIFILSLPTEASVIFTATGGVNNLKTKELNNNNGSAGGSYSGFSLGYLNKEIEIGVYSSNINSKTQLSHDDTDNDYNLGINSIGAYLTHYRESLYFGIGYGKATIKEKLTTSLTGNSLDTLKDIYNIPSDGETSSSEVRALIGFKLLNISSLTLSIYGQKVKMLETSHDDTNFGLELKINI